MGINQTDFQSKVNPVAYYVLFLKQKYKALMKTLLQMLNLRDKTRE